MDMTPDDFKALRTAKRVLEHTRLSIRIANALGKPIEKGIELLPERWIRLIRETTRRALQAALAVAVRSLDKRTAGRSHDRLHRIVATATGAGGGAFGLPALVVELPISTTVMLRSIADIARNEGEDLRSTEAKLACLEVFALGGPSSGDDAAEAGYFGVRAGLAQAVSRAAAFITQGEMVRGEAPVIVRLISQIASRFGMIVGEKAAAQMLPLVGAAGGAVVNLLFIEHFQDVAKAHFTVRRLERTYGPELTRAEYDRC